MSLCLLTSLRSRRRRDGNRRRILKLDCPNPRVRGSTFWSYEVFKLTCLLSLLLKFDIIFVSILVLCSDLTILKFRSSDASAENLFIFSLHLDLVITTFDCFLVAASKSDPKARLTPIFLSPIEPGDFLIDGQRKSHVNASNPHGQNAGGTFFFEPFSNWL